MDKNVGGIDKYLRILVGVVLLIVAAAKIGGLSGIAQGVVALVGIILIVTGVSGYCPLYKIIGVNTAE